jgi:hypothetical protein
VERHYGRRVDRLADIESGHFGGEKRMQLADR